LSVAAGRWFYPGTPVSSTNKTETIVQGPGSAWSSKNVDI